MKAFFKSIGEMRAFLILNLTQALSARGSAMKILY